MIKTKELSKSDCIKIAGKIRENIFEPALSYKTTIFLCGADLTKKTTIRFKVAEILTGSLWYSMSYDLIYPEDIFDELLYGNNSDDLLSLENLLADSVDAVVIIPESAGSYTELGAFANNEKLRNKLICVIDAKYKKNKSFINQGPIKLVKSVNKDGIVYIQPDEIGKGPFSKSAGISTFSTLIRDNEVDKITTAIRKLKKNNSRLGDKITLLQLDRFLLPVIFLLEPVTKLNLIQIVENVIEDEKNTSSSTITALSILTKKRFIELTAEGYKLTQLGSNEFLSFRKRRSRYKQQDKTIAIDNLRLEILNLKYRKKKLKVG